MTNVLHPQTEAQLQNLAQDMPQSLLLYGRQGIGLTTAIERLARQRDATLIMVLPEKDEKIDREKGVISVASVRRLYDLTKTIESGQRFVVIDYAERMGAPAQNAFLKLLEEPGDNTYFILLTHEPGRLLPTVLSRVSHQELRPISIQQSEQLLDELGVTDERYRAQLLFIAAGLPAELTRLVQDPDYFAVRSQIMRDARSFLQGTAYDRLMLAQKYKDDRHGSLTLLEDALNLVKQNIEAGKTDLLPAIEQLLQARERILANGNVRLQLAAAMV